MPFAPRRRQQYPGANCTGFTLIELLVVISIILVMAVLLVPAFTAIKGGSDLASAAHSIADALQGARAYAIANNTYVWVGFYEEDTTAPSPTAAAPAVNAPPYTGKGRVLVATVASKDGTTVIDDGASGTVELTPARLIQPTKLVKIEGIHLTDLGTPTGGNPNSLGGRSDRPYTTKDGPQPTQNRISSDNAETTRRPFVAQNYKFWKTIRFSPRGEANLNSTYGLRRIAEIGLRPTHGTAVDTNSRNMVAIQFTGVASNVKIYQP